MASIEKRATPVAPKSEAELLDWVRLIRSRRVGPSTFHRLVGEYGSVKDALGALPQIAANAGVKNYELCPIAVAEAEIRNGRMAGAVLIPFGDARYPEKLAAIGDAPPLLWALGDLNLFTRPSLSIVGARKASSVGVRLARTMARDLSQDFAVVSGLALGVDTAVHEGALEGGTIAVMPGGVDVVYPAQNAVLAQQIAQSGLRISEHAPGTAPLARHFPQRNRIITALSPALIVIEAAAKSGSISAAKSALDQGRDVLAVPGHPFDTRMSGCNILIRDGATLVRSSSDVRELVMPGPEPDKPTKQLTLFDPTKIADLHKQILALAATNPISEDALIHSLNLGPSEVMPALVALEMDGLVGRDPSGKICAL